jgi:phosphate transport system substrate-binding protein
VLTLLIPACAPPGPPGVRVRLAGAQIPVELVGSWLHDAKSRTLATDQIPPVNRSQHGFENLARGECDLACTDRVIASRELEQFGDRHVRGYRVAFYGYALYVHPDNPLDSVYVGHLRMVFQKRITDWKQLAGSSIPSFEGPIQLYGPHKGSRGGSVLAPLAKTWFADATWQELDSDADIVAHVAADPLALGFASIGYDRGVRYLGLRMERTGAPAFPSLEAIESERYDLAKLIYIFFIDPPSPAVQAVLDYLWSDEGRAAIERIDLSAVPRDRAAVRPVR